jgi:hypothetical protein
MRVRESPRAPFKIGNAARAQPGLFRQCFLCQASGESVAPQQYAEGSRFVTRGCSHTRLAPAFSLGDPARDAADDDTTGSGHNAVRDGLMASARPHTPLWVWASAWVSACVAQRRSSLPCANWQHALLHRPLAGLCRAHRPLATVWETQVIRLSPLWRWRDKSDRAPRHGPHECLSILRSEDRARLSLLDSATHPGIGPTGARRFPCLTGRFPAQLLQQLR